MGRLLGAVAVTLCVAGGASAQSVCKGDASRTVFAGGDSGQSGGACRQFADQQSCEQAYNIGENGVESCFWDENETEGSPCKGCGPNNASSGACTNTCLVIECEGDPGLTFVGPPFSGQSGGSCPSLTNQGECEAAFTFGENGAASCYWDGDFCAGCGPSNESDGACVNTCRINDCAGDPTREFVGPPFSGQQGGACRSILDETDCNNAFHLGSSGFASCFWDVNAGDGGECRGCGRGNEQGGEGNPEGGACTNTCRICEEDPSRTIFAGYAGSQACRQFDSDPTSCEQAYHVGGDDVPTSCFSTTLCEPCGGDRELAVAGAVTSGISDPQPTQCVNTCIPQPPCADASRTNFLSGPGTAACHVYDNNQAVCEMTYILGGDGVANCYYDDQTDLCNGCGGRNESDGACENTCRTLTCDGAPGRSFVPGVGQNGGACPSIGDETTCNDSFILGDDGPTSCFWDTNSAQCKGCGPNNEGPQQCTNECRVNSCANDSSRTVFGGAFGGQSGGGCPQYTDQTSCEIAYIYGDDGFASCFWDDNASPQCRGCGSSNEGQQLCTNTCRVTPPCTNDPSRTIFVGAPGSEGCHQYDEDETNCALAYNQGAGGVTSCYYEQATQRCNGCGPDNVNDGRCENTCMPQVCDDSSKTFGPCERFDDDPTGCAQAFEASEEGPAACVAVPACLGCGINNQAEGACVNACESGPQPTSTPTSTPTNTPTLRADLPDGSTCIADTECTSINCEQGVCCATMCDGVAGRCDLPGTLGTCVPVAAAAPAVTPWGLVVGLLALVGIGALGFRSARAR